jgi:hypothetical protein
MLPDYQGNGHQCLSRQVNRVQSFEIIGKLQAPKADFANLVK